MGALLRFWEALATRNEIPTAVAAADASDAAEDLAPLDPLLAGFAARLVPDLPGPLPATLFDAAAARAVAAVVHLAARALHAQPGDDAGLARAIEMVPIPATAAAHVTQAALGWLALPILRRMQGRALSDPKSIEAHARQLAAFLAGRPLLSLREDAEAIFVGEPPPHLDGLEGTEGLRRWLVQRLASPCTEVPRLARRCWTLERIWKGWSDPVRTAREVLFQWAGRLGPEPVFGPIEDGWLLVFTPLLARSAWPPDLDPAFEHHLAALLAAHAQQGPEPPPDPTEDSPDAGP